MRKVWLPLGVAVVTCAIYAVPAASGPAAAPAAAGAAPIYLDRAYSPDERAADLVSRLTLPEKAAEMNSSQAAAIPRLGIQAYGWWNEAAHGVAREGTLDNANPPTLVNTTSYPVDLALGSTWDPSLMYREATQISDEAREVVRDNTLDLNFYSPTVNLSRDPRWGRNDETFSEDPLLTGEMAARFVDGMEGKDPSGRMLAGGGGYLKTSTTLKHFAANNSEVNRRTGSSDMDDRTLREYYTAQFRGAVRQSQPASIMSSYNEVNGVPAAADGYLIDRLARQTFGFTGFFTSDCDAIFEIQAGHHWQPPGFPNALDEIQRHAFANAAGEDLDCQRGFHDGFSYGNTIPTAVADGIDTPQGRYTENDVDVSLVRLFAVRIQLGEFDGESQVPWVAQARARLAPGTWTNSDANNAVTETPQRLAMARATADQSIVLLKNAGTTRRDGGTGPLLPLRVPAHGPYRVAVVGFYANPPSMYLGGYASAQGPAGVAKSVNGLAGITAAVRAINPDAVVDFLPGTTPGGVASVDPASVAAAANYDAVIVYAGTDASTAREDVDRTTLALPGAQADMISQVAAANPNTVVYLETTGEVDVTGFAPKVPALLWSSYNGQRKGEALADVLLGAADPSGHLPFTWYQDATQLPPITDYAIRPTATTAGRTYMYFSGPVSYPFGHGLSYTDFRYSRLRTDRRLDANGTLRATVDVTNTGRVAGAEVAQLYVSTPDAPAALQRPVKRLAGFQKVFLRPHQTQRLSFSVRIGDLAFFDQSHGRYEVDSGRYGVQLGTSSADRDIQQRATVAVSGTLRPVPATVTAKPQLPTDAAAGIAARVMFPAGAVVLPQLALALSDDTLYGHLDNGVTSPLPAGARVRYRSNRPHIVSVDRAGTVRTIAPGVATITATVDYRGTAKSATFVVRVT
ncbi:MAG: beta-glucosidase [Mycobacteriales bacterium]